MEIEKFEIDDPKRQHTTPFVLVLPNTGCSLPDCHCSDGWILSVSNGKVGLAVKFDNEKEFRKVFGDLNKRVEIRLAKKKMVK